MADRVLFISWGQTARGTEERSLEVFNEALGILGRMQQDLRIEKFAVVLLNCNGDLGGYIEVFVTIEQLTAVLDDEEFLLYTIVAVLIVVRLTHVYGWAIQGVAP